MNQFLGFAVVWMLLERAPERLFVQRKREGSEELPGGYAPWPCRRHASKMVQVRVKRGYAVSQV